jgi:hypothetical protein
MEAQIQDSQDSQDSDSIQQITKSGELAMGKKLRSDWLDLDGAYHYLIVT